MCLSFQVDPNQLQDALVFCKLGSALKLERCLERPFELHHWIFQYSFLRPLGLFFLQFAEYLRFQSIDHLMQLSGHRLLWVASRAFPS